MMGRLRELYWLPLEPVDDLLGVRMTGEEEPEEFGVCIAWERVVLKGV